jgi:hypothetical protein
MGLPFHKPPLLPTQRMNDSSFLPYIAMNKTLAKLLFLTNTGLISVALVTGFGLSFQPKKLSFSTLAPAQAQASCDTAIRTAPFSGKTSGSATGKPNINTMLRAGTSTSSSVLNQIPPNTSLRFTGWTYGQGIRDIWTGNMDYRWFRVTYNGLTGWVASGVIYGNPPNAPLTPNCQGWLLPWPSGVTARVSQSWHYDPYTRFNSAVDFALPAGTSVRAPVDSTVLDQCNAGNNHRAIKLQASNGQIYSLVHVTAANVKSSYRAGEKIGTIAADKPWNNCAKSTGPHLHMAFPTKPFTIGGYTFGDRLPTSVTSR